MSMLANLKTDDSIANERDSLGNSGPVESGLYPSTITLAYLTKAKSEALALNVHAKTDSGREIRETIYMSSGKEKGCTNFYIDKDGQKQYLPGFLTANALALLTVGKEISDLETEQKVVNLYSPEVKAEVPTKVDALTELHGQEVLLGVIKEIVDKQKKNDATGVYEPTGETREQNTIDKVFRARDRMTTTEIRAKAEEATFVDQWDAKWTGKDRNRVKGAAAGNGTAGAPKAATANKKPTTSLFA